MYSILMYVVCGSCNLVLIVVLLIAMNIVVYYTGNSQCTCDCLGCAELLCLVCLFDLACFFLSSFSSLIKNMYIKKKYNVVYIRSSKHS